jgi:carboxymethylenebutenolidase
MRTWFITLLLVSVCTAATAQDWARERVEKSPRHTEWVDVKHGERTVKAFVVYPERSDKAPAVLVIHEIYGLTDWIRSLCDQLAEAGYIAIAPDLLSGMAPGGGRTSDFESQSKVVEAISSLPPDQITADLNAVADYVKSLPACNGKIAVAGFCWGGTQSFRFATNRSDLSAAFVFYGTGPSDAESIRRINCPVYGFYAENDARVNATLEATSRIMKGEGKVFEPVTYAGAAHGFMRAGEDPNGSEGNKKAREAAWARWKELLRKVFG